MMVKWWQNHIRAGKGTMSVSGCRNKGINSKQKHDLSTMSKVGYGLKVTV